MKSNALCRIVIFFAGAVLGLGMPQCFAGPPSNAGPFLTLPEETAVIRAGYDCGYDYPCLPEPRPRVRSFYGDGQVYIHKNYGTVNIYVPRRREFDPPRGPLLPPPGAGPGDGEGPGGASCDGRPCDGNCGPLCWLHRYREGYCGHGCDVYREGARFDGDEREGAYPPPPYYRAGEPRPPRYPDANAAPPPTRFEQPAPLPRRRFDGPRYPPGCSGDDC